MNWQAISFDWNQVRAFLATAEEGSLSAAARALGQTQPTLSRQVAALEEDLGVTLFERAGRAMALTDAGRDLMEHVRIMADAATQVSLVASGQSQVIEGKVVITATGAMATYHLPPIIRKIRDQAPGITLDIVTSNEVQDLTRREADISIRHARPTQPDLIAKLIGESAAHLYASEDYVRTLGPVENLKDLEDADFIGFDRNDELIAEMARHGLSLTHRNFTLNSRAGTVMRELVAQGLGIGFLTRDIEQLDPRIRPILPDKITLPVPVWLVTHRELHTSKRIRVVYDILAEELPKSPMV
ncbi:MAG: LysR family transcriptional regulator [Hyphomonadaceae bacterium]|nr:LysR family transcriptional regulator [Hyphomonadaceae bacterium]